MKRKISYEVTLEDIGSKLGIKGKIVRVVKQHDQKQALNDDGTFAGLQGKLIGLKFFVEEEVE